MRIFVVPIGYNSPLQIVINQSVSSSSGLTMISIELKFFELTKKLDIKENTTLEQLNRLVKRLFTELEVLMGLFYEDQKRKLVYITSDADLSLALKTLGDKLKITVDGMSGGFC